MAIYWLGAFSRNSAVRQVSRNVFAFIHVFIIIKSMEHCTAAIDQSYDAPNSSLCTSLAYSDASVSI